MDKTQVSDQSVKVDRGSWWHNQGEKSLPLGRNLLQYWYHDRYQQRAACSSRGGPRWTSYRGRGSEDDLHDHHRAPLRAGTRPQPLPPRDVPGQDPGPGAQQLRLLGRPVAHPIRIQTVRPWLQCSLLSLCKLLLIVINLYCCCS